MSVYMVRDEDFDRLRATENAFADLCTKYLELRTELPGGALSYAYALKDAVNMLEEENLALRAQNDVLNDEKDHLRAEVLARDATIKDLRSEPSYGDRYTKSLEDDVRSLNDECVAHAKDVVELQDELEELRLKRDADNRENRRLLDELDELEPLWKYDQTLTVPQLIQCYEEAGHRNAEWLDAQNELKALRMEASQLRAENNRLLDKIWELESNATESRIAHQRRFVENDDLKHDIERLYGSNSDLASDYAELSAKYEELRAYHQASRFCDAAKVDAFDQVVALCTPYVEGA